MKALLLLVSLCLSMVAWSEDLDSGKSLFRSCAFCHGQQAQGIEGGRFPRLAGMSDDYLIRQLKDFRAGRRDNESMVIVGRIRSLSDEQIADLADYMAAIRLAKGDNPLDVATLPGDINKGRKLYKRACRRCHGRKGRGKRRTGAPPLAGQYGEYLQAQIENFKVKERYHDNDEDDDTFYEYSNQEIGNILAYITTLDDRKPSKRTLK